MKALPPDAVSAAASAYDRILMRRMMFAFYWLDDALQAYLQRETGLSVPRAQSMLMVCISEGVHRQSELAERLGVSKQAVQQALKGLIDKGLVTVAPDPANGRQKLVNLTDAGGAMRDKAREGLQRIEGLLATRIGADRLDALREVLAMDWGPIPADDQGEPKRTMPL